MRLEWLRCFNEIVKTNSMTQAAQNLFLSQPAVSKMIHALEKEIGETLFIRSPFGVQLTEQGELFTKFAREVTKAHEAYLLEKNQPISKACSYTGTIELAISPLLLQTFYQPITQKMKQRFPELHLCFIEADNDSAEELIMANPAILGLVLIDRSDPSAPHQEIVMKALYYSSIIICTAKNSRYASLKTASPSDIPSEDLIAIEFAKQNSQQPQGAFNFYTVNLELIRQKLLYDDHVCVMLPQFIAERKLISPGIIQLQRSVQTTVSVDFFYHRQSLRQQLYPPDFLSAFQETLTKCLMS